MLDFGVFKDEFEKLNFDLQVHVVMIINISNMLAEISNNQLDKQKLLACAVLHDSKNDEKNHAEVGAIYAKNFLRNRQFSDDFIKDVFNAIYYHSAKPVVDDFTIACFYDADILCRFYSLGVLRAWNNIQSNNKTNWKSLFNEISKKQDLENYFAKMKQKLQLDVSKNLLESKKYEFLFSYELLSNILSDCK